MGKKYGIGLDIGTSSIGWSVVDESGHLIRVKGQTGLGVRLFHEGQTAEERRTFRTTRRRLSRRRWRLRLLRELFDAPISAIDKNFFARQKLSSLSPQDKYFASPYHLLDNRSDQDFYQQYPTIYHLRQALMTNKRQFDLREIYLAIHHIVKYRGNFLSSGTAKDFKPGELKLETYFETLNAQLAILFIDEPIQLPSLNWDELVTLLTDTSQSRNDRQKAVVKQLMANGDSQWKKFYTAFTKAILGLKAQVGLLVGIQDATDIKTLTFSLDSLEDHQEDMTALLSDEQVQFIDLLAKLYAALQLTIIIPDGQTFSGQMVKTYEIHKRQLKDYKTYIAELTDYGQRMTLKKAYDDYIDNGLPQVDFYKKISSVLKKQETLSKLGQSIQIAVEQEEFLPKQRSKTNIAIPYQVQQQELDQIIENQSRYYPWLKTPNPVTKRRKMAPYKLDELVCFRVPYYVGPLVQPDPKNATKETKFAWMTRQNPQSTVPITPWNFDQQVDRQASANAFIQRMKTTDTYLIGEDVIPKNSLLYQRYEVLNELNNVRVNGELLAPKKKQRIYHQLFIAAKKTTVTIKDLQNNLIANGDVDKQPEIKGLADPKRFLSRLSTYHDLQKIIPEALEQQERQADIEKIINWSTVFEDAKIFKEKLQEVTWLTPTQIRQLNQHRYREWGQFSEKLLLGIHDKQGRNIMDLLWQTTDNFMQIVRRPEFQRSIATINQQDLNQQNLQQNINELYTSPQNKKAIRQVLLVVADIQEAMHGVAPSWLFIEAARGADQRPQRTNSRQAQLVEAYGTSAAHELVDEAVRQRLVSANENLQHFSDKLVLYFQQNGRDIYTGKALNPDSESFSNYHIDHIIPQNVIKDDSIDNRVLTLNAVNEKKGPHVPIIFKKSQEGFWRRLHQVGLISRRKLENLLTTPEDIDRHAIRFVARQLVETRQVIKLVTAILSQQYDPEITKLVSIKAGLSHQFREKLKLPKLRELNDYHHAHDAYLAARIGTYLLQRYPKLESFFVYGKYKTTKFDLRRHFNFIEQIIGGDSEKNREIENPETHQIIWNKQDEIEYVEWVMGLKRLLVTHEVYDNHGAMFDQTIYSAKTAKNKKLIPRKLNQPTELYGGFSGEKTSYLAIVRLLDKKAPYYQVVRVPTRLSGQLEKLDDLGKRTLLRQWFTPMFTTKKGKQRTFEIVAPHVYLEQPIIDQVNGQRHRFGLGTDTYYHNQQQLVLSLETQRNLINKGATDTDLDSSYMAAYYEICKQVERYFPLYDMNKFKERLIAAEGSFKELSTHSKKDEKGNLILGKREVLMQILQGLHANATIVNLNNIGCTRYFGQLQVPGGLKLTEQAILIHESPTGLFRRLVRLNDM